MNISNEKELEMTFNAICKDHSPAEPPDLWPAVESAITHKQKDHIRARRRLGFAGALAAITVIVLFFAAPGFTQNAIRHLRQLLGGAFSLSMGDREISGVLITENGEEKELTIDGNVVKVKMTPMYENSVLIGLSVYIRNEAGELRLVSMPKVVTLKGTPAEIKVTGLDGKVIYKFTLTPETDAKFYRGNISTAQ